MLSAAFSIYCKNLKGCQIVLLRQQGFTSGLSVQFRIASLTLYNKIKANLKLFKFCEWKQMGYKMELKCWKIPMNYTYMSL